MFKNLMIPSDGSKYSQNATELGIDLASKINADIIAVYVLDEFTDYTYDSLEDEGNEILANITKKAEEKGVKVCEHLITGNPIRDMELISIRTNADAIIISTHGKDESKDGTIGSVTDKVIKTFKIPIILVK
jgi:nucleotide-binding universal stress UspA family protein